MDCIFLKTLCLLYIYIYIYSVISYTLPVNGPCRHQVKYDKVYHKKCQGYGTNLQHISLSHELICIVFQRPSK